jgi:hypothetical protein
VTNGSPMAKERSGNVLPNLGIDKKTQRKVLLTVQKILMWADEHHQRTGKWPHAKSSPVYGVPGEAWNAISVALRRGLRGLPGRSSLTTLLAQRRI